MNYSRVRFTLDLHKNQAQVSIPVSIGDTAKIFYINFTDGGQPFFLSEGCLAKMSIKRPTGTSLEGRMFIGLQAYPGGRLGEAAAYGLSDWRRKNGIQTKYLSNGI